MSLSSTMHMLVGYRPYSVKIERVGGYLDHYYHFIMDFVWPIHEWLRSSSRNWSDVQWLMTEVERELFFKDLLKEMLGQKIRQGNGLTRRIARTQLAKQVVLKGYNSRVRSYLNVFEDRAAFQDSHRSLVEFIATRSPRHPASDRARVVLIERGMAKDNRGAVRRAIESHEELAGSLAEHYSNSAVSFESVRFEDLDFFQQFGLLRSGATILIGQHGAGLLNGIWLKDSRSSVIEIAGQDNPPHFQNLLEDLGIGYQRLICDTKGAYGQQQLARVDPQALIDLIGTLTKDW